MPKLSAMQITLLADAASCESGSLLPAADSIADNSAQLEKALAGLLKRGLAEEYPAPGLHERWRTDGAEQLGLFINEAGRAAVARRADAETPTTAPAALPRLTKVEAVLALLRREQGATLAELVAETGWLPHTTRAALTGLRKKGHVLEKTKRDEVTCYRVAVGA